MVAGFMRHYVAIAHRWNNLNDHFYIVGIGSDPIQLRSLAEKEVQDRGGKYGVGIYTDDNQLVDYVSTKLMDDEAELPSENPRIEAGQRIGFQVMEAVRSGRVHLHVPGESVLKPTNVDVPDWLRAETEHATRYAEMSALTRKLVKIDVPERDEELHQHVLDALAEFWAMIRASYEEIKPDPYCRELDAGSEHRLIEEAVRAVSNWKEQNTSKDPEEFVSLRMKQWASRSLDEMEGRPQMYAHSYLEFELVYGTHLEYACWPPAPDVEEEGARPVSKGSVPHSIPIVASALHDLRQELGERFSGPLPVSAHVESWDEMVSIMKRWRVKAEERTHGS